MNILHSSAGLRSIYEKHAGLIKNSAAISIGSVSTGVFGFAFWWFAARFFSPDDIGKTSALFSLIGLIGLIGMGGLGTLLTGEVVQWPGRQTGLITAASLTAMIFSFWLGAIGLLLTKSFGVNPSGISNLWFFLGCGITGFVMVLNQGFVGMMQSGFRMAQQFTFSLLKMVILAIGISLSVPGEASMMFSWIAALVISLVIVELMMHRSGKSLIVSPDFKLLFQLKQNAFDHFMLDLSIMGPTTILPYLVAVLISPASNAVFTVLWMIFITAAVVPSAFATVLFPDIRAQPHQYRDKMLLSFGLSLLFASMFGVFVFFFSTELLTIFNPLYAKIGGTDLRYLGFGMIGSVAKFHACAASRLNGSMRRASLWFGIGGLFELSCVSVGCRTGSLAGLSIGWSSAMAIEGIIMVLVMVGSRNRLVEA